MSDTSYDLRSLGFSSQIDTIRELISKSRRAFLLGAGCSKCVNLPLMGELTQKVIAKIELDTTSETYKILSELKSLFGEMSTATIEDYLTDLVDYLSISQRRIDKGSTIQQISIGNGEFEIIAVQTALQSIKDRIADVILEVGNINLKEHRKFVRAVHRKLRSGLTMPTVDYIVLNYDCLLEDALGLEQITYTDGFHGGPTGWWDREHLHIAGIDARVIKVHGSIDWCQLEGDSLPRRIRAVIADPVQNRTMIWPSSTKYRETQNDPFAILMDSFRFALKPLNKNGTVLTICGYSFNDSHINVEIDKALHESEESLTVLVFTDTENLSSHPLFSKWLTDDSIKNQVLFFTKHGFYHGDEKKEVPPDKPLDWWKFEEMTKLLSGEI